MWSPEVPCAGGVLAEAPSSSPLRTIIQSSSPAAAAATTKMMRPTGGPWRDISMSLARARRGLPRGRRRRDDPDHVDVAGADPVEVAGGVAEEERAIGVEPRGLAVERRAVDHRADGEPGRHPGVPGGDHGRQAA